MQFYKRGVEMNELLERLIKGLSVLFVVMVMVLITAVMSLSFEVYLELGDYMHKSSQSGILK